MNRELAALNEDEVDVINGVIAESEKGQTPLLFLDQWLQRASVLYRSDNITACTEAIATLGGEEPALVKIGWVEIRDMKLGLKESKEGFGAASLLSKSSQ